MAVHDNGLGESMPRTRTDTFRAKAQTSRFLYTLRVLYLYLIPTVATRVTRSRLIHRLRGRITSFWLGHSLDRELWNLRKKKEEILRVGRQGYRITFQELGLDRQRFATLAEVAQAGSELVIADIDQDGYLYSHVGPLENAPTIPSKHFVARERHDLQLVAVDGFVGVKKDYRGNRLRFVQETKNLHRLGEAGCNVPAILGLDVERLTLTIAYILGPVLREELAKRGAVLRDRELRQSSDYLALDKSMRAAMRIREGGRALPKVVDAQFIDRLFAQLCKIHAAGVEGNDVKYGNVIIEKRSSQPYWIDFEEATLHKRERGGHGSVLCDRDIEKFNQYFGTEKLTYGTIKERIEREQAQDGDGWKVPIYFGCGLHIGSLWNVEAGYGFWHCFLKHHLPPLAGKRILDLGGSSAFYALQMLRQGAREVVCVEADARSLARAEFVKSAFEWTDRTQYKLELIQAERADIPAMQLGTFDLVVGLSPWLDPGPQSIPGLLDHLSTIARCLVLQAHTKHALEAKGGHRDGHSVLEGATQAIKHTGFHVAHASVPPGGGPPLVIARSVSQS
jgi:tRNA A-37 threonylcarbamoyl transferase component Bud32/SAM-dependent methyltransferase